MSYDSIRFDNVNHWEFKIILDKNFWKHDVINIFKVLYLA